MPRMREIPVPAGADVSLVVHWHVSDALFDVIHSVHDVPVQEFPATGNLSPFRHMAIEVAGFEVAVYGCGDRAPEVQVGVRQTVAT